MNNDNFLTPRMNALWFTYVAIFLFALMPNFGIYLELWQILGFSAAWMILVNLWNISSSKTVMDERKQQIATNGMAWAFVTTSLALVAAGTTNIETNLEFLRDVSEFGLWTFIMYLSLNILYQEFGGGENE